MDQQYEPVTTAVTVGAILDRFEAEYIPHELAPRTARDYRRHVAHLKRLFGDRLAEELKPKDFGPFLNVQGRGKTNRVRQLAVLSSAFSQATSVYFLMERNPLRELKRPKNQPRTRLIRDEEFAGVKALAPLRMRLAMDLALITGQRQGDILNFKWSDISDIPNPDPKTGITQELDVYQSKTGKRIGIGITRDLEAVLDQCWLLPRGGKDGGEYIITRSMGGRFTSEGFRARWQETMRKWMRRGGENFHFHDIRALCATKQPTAEAARQLLGHTTIGMTLRIYRRGKERVNALQLST